MKYDKNLLTAIVCVDIPGENRTFKKFRNIKDTELKIDEFLTFVKKKIPGADHVNFYYKKSREFKKQYKII